MHRLIRFTGALVALVLATAASAEKRDVIIQCAAACEATAAAVAQLGGSVKTRYKNLSAIAASLPAEKLAELSSNAAVKAVAKDVMTRVPTPVDHGNSKGKSVVTLDETQELQSLSAAEVASFVGAQPGDYAFNNTLIGATSVQATTNFGDGIVVGVIDTGVANSSRVATLTGNVIGGENFVTADPVQSATSRANHPHGTWVGTVIAGHGVFRAFNSSNLIRSMKANGAGQFTTPCPDVPLNAPPTAVCGVPIIGVAPNAKIYALKVFDSRGGGAPTSTIIAAMDRAITLKLNYLRGMPSVPVAGTGTEDDPFRYDSLNLTVLNMSLGGPTLAASRDMEDLLSIPMMAVGISLAASAGNDGFVSMTGGSPGTGYSALTVGAASTAAHERILRDVQFGFGFGARYRPANHIQTAYFSSRGPTADGRNDPDVTANGDWTLAQGTCLGYSNSASVQACLAGQIGGAVNFVSGTSFSSPTAAGAMALLKKASPNANAAQIRNALVQTANPNLLGDGSGPIDQGAGFINVAAAAAALAAGKVNSSVTLSNPNTGNDAVRANIRKLGFDTVTFANDRFTTHVSNLKPGQVAQFFLRSRIDTTRFVVNVKNVTPANAPAQQNVFFGDDLQVQINDAGTSFADTRVDDFVGSDTSYAIDNPQSGLVRVAIKGDWTNAGNISADLEITQQRDPLPKQTSNGALSQGSTTTVGVDIPAGTQQAVFELFWEQDWGAYPTNDIDLFLVAPDGTVNVAGATLASPERAVLTNPAPGRYTAVISGFQVNAKDRFTLRATADGSVLKAH